MDPPRAGLDPLTCKLIAQFDKIVYISCNPETLARDLKLLGVTHDAVRLAAFDQFPYSHHLESGVILRRKSPEELAAAAAVAAAAALSSSSAAASSSSSSSAAAAGMTDSSKNSGVNNEEEEEEGSGSDASIVGESGSGSEYIPGVLFKLTNVPTAMSTYQLKDLLSKVARVRYVDRNDDGTTLTLSSHPINTLPLHPISHTPLTSPYQSTQYSPLISLYLSYQYATLLSI